MLRQLDNAALAEAAADAAALLEVINADQQERQQPPALTWEQVCCCRRYHRRQRPGSYAWLVYVLQHQGCQAGPSRQTAELSQQSPLLPACLPAGGTAGQGGS